MATTTQDIPPIRVGRPWLMTIELLTDSGAPDPVFTAGRTFVGKCWRGDQSASLADATVTPVTTNVASISLTASQTATFSALSFSTDADGLQTSRIQIDIIRTDTDPDEAIDLLISAEVWRQPS